MAPKPATFRCTPSFASALSATYLPSFSSTGSPTALFRLLLLLSVDTAAAAALPLSLFVSSNTITGIEGAGVVLCERLATCDGGREGKKKKKGNGKKGGKTKTTKQRLNAGVRSAKDGGEGWRRTHPRANRKNNDNYSCQVCVWAYFKDIIGGECEEEGWVGDAA